MSYLIIAYHSLLSFSVALQVLSLFDGISGCLVALKQLGFEIDTYVSSEVDEYSKIVTMIRHREATQVGDARGINEKKILQEHGPFDLLVGGFPCNDFANDGSLRNHKSGMHFQIYVEILKSCAKQHQKVIVCLRENVVTTKMAMLLRQ